MEKPVGICPLYKEECEVVIERLEKDNKVCSYLSDVTLPSLPGTQPQKIRCCLPEAHMYLLNNISQLLAFIVQQQQAPVNKLTLPNRPLR